MTIEKFIVNAADFTHVKRLSNIDILQTTLRFLNINVYSSVISNLKMIFEFLLDFKFTKFVKTRE
jgi:hypothetical protein